MRWPGSVVPTPSRLGMTITRYLVAGGSLAGADGLRMPMIRSTSLQAASGVLREP